LLSFSRLLIPCSMNKLVKPILVGVGVSILYALIAILLPKSSLIVSSVRSSFFTSGQIFRIILTIIESWNQTNTLSSRIILYSGTVLAGLQAGLVVYWYERQKSVLGIKKSGVGFVVGAVSASCASCGSFIIGSLVGLSASSVFLSYLPYQGLELGVIGILILLWSVITTIKKIRSPIVCEV